MSFLLPLSSRQGQRKHAPPLGLLALDLLI